MGTVTYLKNYEPEQQQENILKFPLMNFFRSVFEEIKKLQDEITKKKTNFIYKKAYGYFLDLYLMRRAKEGKVDFPDFMYETGRIICAEAQAKADEVMLQIIQKGQVNELYTKWKKGN